MVLVQVVVGVELVVVVVVVVALVLREAAGRVHTTSSRPSVQVNKCLRDPPGGAS